jgi:hypothetical protein
MSRIEFSRVLPALEALRSDVIAEMKRAPSSELVKRKTEIDAAIACLELCAEHQIGPRSRITRIPEPATRTPSSEFRLIEDRESDDRALWREVTIGGHPIRPLPGALIVESG